jgi:tRNA A37 threonylcarbamoyladenosine modification protein TsaB
MAHAGDDVKNGYLCPMIDALRGQVFSALYRRTGGGLTKVFAETMAPADLWMKKVKARAGQHPLWLSPLQGCYPEADVLLSLARSKLAKAGPQSYKSVLPLYIRRAAAQERKG